MKKTNTINENNKLIKHLTKPVTLICLRFEFELSWYIVVEIKKIPAKGINDKNLSNIRY